MRCNIQGAHGFHGVVLSGFKVWALGGRDDGLTAFGLKSGDFRGCWDLVCFLDLGASVVRTFSALNPEPNP